MNQIANPFSDEFKVEEPPKKITTEEMGIKTDTGVIDPNAAASPPWEAPAHQLPETKPTIQEVEEVVADIKAASDYADGNAVDSVIKDGTCSSPSESIINTQTPNPVEQAHTTGFAEPIQPEQYSPTAPVGTPIFQPHQQPMNQTPPPQSQMFPTDINTPDHTRTPTVQQQPFTQSEATPRPPFSPPQEATNTFDNYTNDKDKIKYKIFDLYWLVNSKVYSGEQLGAYDSPMLCISYNVDFGNLRFLFCRPTTTETCNSTSIELNSVEKMCTFNVYPEIAEQVLLMLDQSSGMVRNLERLFKRGSNWTPPQAAFKKDEHGFHIMSKNGSQHVFTINQQWQLNALKRSMEFTLDNANLLNISKFL